MHVCVVGGGVVGLAVAYELRRRDVAVTVFERDDVGGAASKGNAGWVVPALAEPLTGPGLLGRLVRMVADPHSPLRVRTVPDRQLLRWTRAAIAGSRGEHHERDRRALAHVAAGVFEAFDDLRNELDSRGSGAFGMREDGLLTVFTSQAAAARFAEDQATLARAGYDSGAEVLDGQSARRLEPALSDAVVGAVLLPQERSVDPSSVVAALARGVVASGGAIHERTAVRTMHRRHGSWLLDAGSETIAADQVVVAAGAWTNRLLSRLGATLPIVPARGCSLTSAGRGTAPQRPLKLADAQVACSPLDTGVRVSGTFDLVPDRATLSKRRLEAVVRLACPYFADWRPSPVAEDGWAGLRPATPDGIPIVGPLSGLDGLVVATGHGTLGVTLAPVTARAVAEIVTVGSVPQAFAACSADRFRASYRTGFPNVGG